MKNNRVFLHNWQGDPGDEYVDIPWPTVHQCAGADMIAWLDQQDHCRAQMILEQTADGWQSLWAEFYDEQCRTEFALRFAK